MKVIYFTDAFIRVSGPSGRWTEFEGGKDQADALAYALEVLLEVRER